RQGAFHREHNWATQAEAYGSGDDQKGGEFDLLRQSDSMPAIPILCPLLVWAALLWRSRARVDKCHDISHVHETICQSSSLRWRRAKRLVNANEIVPNVVERQSVTVI